MEDCGYLCVCVCVIKLALRHPEVRTELHVERCADLVFTKRAFSLYENKMHLLKSYK